MTDLYSESKESDDGDGSPLRNRPHLRVSVESTKWTVSREESCVLARHADHPQATFFPIESRVFYLFYLLAVVACTRVVLAAFLVYAFVSWWGKAFSLYLLGAALSSLHYYCFVYSRHYAFEQGIDASFAKRTFLSEFLGWLALCSCITILGTTT